MNGPGTAVPARSFGLGPLRVELRSNDRVVAARLVALLEALGPPTEGSRPLVVQVDARADDDARGSVTYETRVDGTPFLSSPDLREHETVLTRVLNSRRLGAECDLLHVHSAGVARAGGAVLLPARAGSGKSTLTAALVRDGWGYLTDELVVLQPPEGRVIPYPRPVTLRADSWPLFVGVEGIPPGSAHEPEQTQIEMPPRALGVVHGPEPVVVSAIITPRYQPGADDLQRLATAAETVEILAACCYDLERLGWHGVETLVRVAAYARGWRLNFDDVATATVRVSEAFDAAPATALPFRHLPPPVPELPVQADKVQRAAGVHGWAFGDGSTVLYDPAGLTLAQLDAVGTALWERLTQPVPVRALLGVAPDESPAAAETRRGWVNTLLDAGLLVRGGPGTRSFDNAELDQVPKHAGGEIDDTRHR